jgi:hypothetical protein
VRAERVGDIRPIARERDIKHRRSTPVRRIVVRTVRRQELDHVDVRAGELRVLREQPAGARHQTDEQNGGYPSRAADLVRLLIEGAR